LTVDEIFPNSPALDGSEAGGGVFPAGFFAPFGNPRIAESTRRKKERQNHESIDSA
jgi:hypothetical protein